MMSRGDGERSWKGQGRVCPGHASGGERRALFPASSGQQAKENPPDGDLSGA